MTAMNEAWDRTFKRMWETGIVPHYINRLNIHGYSRTGKSTLVHELTKSERVTFHEAMPLEDLIGGMTLVDGSTRWVDGPAARALRRGTILQIDELNDMPPEVRTMVYALMDSPAGITLPTGERLEAAPGYGVITTMNPAPDCLPHPIFDRIDCFLKADTLSEGIRKALGPVLASKAENVLAYNQAPLVWERPATVNSLLALKALRSAGVNDEEATHMLGFRGMGRSDFLTMIAER